MEQRRRFLKVVSAMAVPIAAIGSIENSAQRADDKRVLGTWSGVRTLPFPPGSFREFLSFSEGGVIHETNSFLHTASNVDFSSLGLPSVVNASDGLGNWTLTRESYASSVSQVNVWRIPPKFGDLHVTGTIRIDDQKLHADWHIQVVDIDGNVILDFGDATSESTRLE